MRMTKELYKTELQPIDGVIDFIKRLYELNKKIYVISGSDEKELIQILKKEKYFIFLIKYMEAQKVNLKTFHY